MASCKAMERRMKGEYRAMHRAIAQERAARHRRESISINGRAKTNADMRRRIAKADTAVAQAIRQVKTQATKMVNVEKALSRCKRR